MSSLLSLALAVVLQLPTTTGVHELSMPVDGVGPVLYGLSIPRGYDPARPAPLVVVLHSGGERMRHYGAAFTRFLVEPALRDLQPIIVAPDCPTDAWTDDEADAAVMAVVARVMAEYAVDRSRVVVTGYSMGGRGTWDQAARHPDLYTAAIPMAASTGTLAAGRLGQQPTFVIHSRRDERVPFAPAEQNARALAGAGKPVHFEAVNDFTHFEMFRYVEALRRGGRWVAERWTR